jgi:hypothetical protein
MLQSVSEIIYQSFFERLSDRADVNAETIDVLKSLYAAKQITNKQRLLQLTQEMEARHAQDKNDIGS